MLGTKSETAFCVDADARIDVAGCGHECGCHTTHCAVLAWSKHSGNLICCFDEFLCCHVWLCRFFGFGGFEQRHDVRHIEQPIRELRGHHWRNPVNLDEIVREVVQRN